MTNVNMNIHCVVSVKQKTTPHETFTVTSLHIEQASGEVTIITLFNDESIRPDNIKWSKTYG